MLREEVDIPSSLARGRLVVPATLQRLWADYSGAAGLIVGSAGFGFAVDRTAPGGAFWLSIAAVVGLLGCVLGWLSYRSRALRVIRVPGQRDEVAAEVRRAVEALGWNCVHADEELLVARTKPTGFTWGQQVTLIARDGEVAFNSRSSRHGKFQPSYGWNRKHFSALSEYLQSGPLSGGLGADVALKFDPDAVRSRRNIGCAVGLVPVLGLLAMLIDSAIREGMGQRPPPTYVGEPVHGADTTLGVLLFLGGLASFFLVALANLALGLLANRARPIISIPLTLGALAALMFVSAELVTDGSSSRLAGAGVMALAAAAVSGFARRRR